MKYLVISKGTEMLRIPEDRLMYILSDGNYSHVFTADGRQHLVTMQLGVIEDLIADLFGDTGGRFIRIGRSLIINIDYVYFIDITKQLLVISDCAGSYFELSASREVLQKLKTHLESTGSNE